MVKADGYLMRKRLGGSRELSGEVAADMTDHLLPDHMMVEDAGCSARHCRHPLP